MSSITILIYVVALITISIWSSRKNTGTEGEFFTSGRDHGPWLTSFSASASSESGWVVLGLTASAYSLGWQTLWLLPGCAAGYLLNWRFVGPKLIELQDQTGGKIVSMGDIFAAKFGEKASRLSINLIGLIIVSVLTIYVSTNLLAAGKLLQGSTSMPMYAGVTAAALLIFVYISIGGLRAISWTDFFQATLMVATLLGLPLYAFLYIGQGNVALPSLIDTPNATAGLGLLGGAAGMSAVGLVIGWMGIGLGYPGLPHVLRRFLSAKSTEVIRPGSVIALLWSQTSFLGAILLGVILRSLNFETPADNEQVVPALAATLNPIATGIIIAAVFSAIISSADSMLLEVSSAVSRDIGRKRTSSSNIVMVRFVLAAVLVIAVALALGDLGSVFEKVLRAWSLLAATIGVAILMTFLDKNTSPDGLVAGMLTGVATVLIWPEFVPGLYEIVPGMAFAAAVCAVVSRMRKSEHVLSSD